MASWYPSVLTYKEFAQANTFFADITGSIENQTDQIKRSIDEHKTSISEQTKQIVASNSQIVSALENGFNHIAQINERGFDQVSSAVEALHSDLNYNFGLLIQRMEYQNSVLTNILKTIQAPFETQVREYYSKGCDLANGGILDTAIEYFKKSIALPTGDIFFPSYYQLGRLYLFGVEDEINIIDPKIATEYLLIANKFGNGLLKAKTEGFGGEPIVGLIYTGKVTSIKEFGAFVEFLPNLIGFLHISEIENFKLESMDGVLEIGEKIQVKLLDKDSKGFKLSRKAAINETANTIQKSKSPFSSVLADCKFFLSQSFYYQLTGNKNSVSEEELLNNAIKYCKEAIALNPNLSQAYYHLAKYYSYKNDIEISLSFLKKAIEIDRVYSIHVFKDKVFEQNKEHVIQLLSTLKNNLRQSVEPHLRKAKLYITEFQSKGISQFQNLDSEFKQVIEEVRLAEMDFNTGTYFGFDDCRKKLEKL
jgi:predicted RNA-binding protein with RPS1 domain